jgi:hypothetical protein
VSPPPRDSRNQRINNLMVGALLLLLLVAGVWIFNAIDAAKKAQECLESRRRNCTIIETPK